MLLPRQGAHAVYSDGRAARESVCRARWASVELLPSSSWLSRLPRPGCCAGASPVLVLVLPPPLAQPVTCGAPQLAHLHSMLTAPLQVVCAMRTLSTPALHAGIGAAL